VSLSTAALGLTGSDHTKPEISAYKIQYDYSQPSTFYGLYKTHHLYIQ